MDRCIAVGGGKYRCHTCIAERKELKAERIVLEANLEQTDAIQSQLEEIKKSLKVTRSKFRSYDPQVTKWFMCTEGVKWVGLEMCVSRYVITLCVYDIVL